MDKILIYGNKINKEKLSNYEYYHTKDLNEFKSIFEEYKYIIQVRANICIWKINLIIHKEDDYNNIDEYIDIIKKIYII